jgi:hypothetical protein
VIVNMHGRTTVKIVAEYIQKMLKTLSIVCRSLAKHTNGNMTGTEGGGYRGR